MHSRSEDWRSEANLDDFWNLVSLARADRAAFLETMRNMDRRGLIRFSWIFEELAAKLGREPYANHTRHNLSEDSLDDLWEEVVGKGKAFYESIIAHPERMLVEVDYSDPSHRMRYDTSAVFHERYGEEIPPHSYDY